MTKKPMVAVLGAGGTISTIVTDPLDFVNYVETGRKADADEILKRLPDLGAIADCHPVHLNSVSSTAIGPYEWLEMAGICRKLTAYESGYEGVVILHGTGSLEESAFFLNLVLDTRKPVVVVGSQRPFNALSSDGPINLLAAVSVAASQRSAGRGRWS